MMLQTVVETPEYIRWANSRMDNSSRESFINHIAEHPLIGELISETGGARKARWTSNHNQGKRGGVRVIYYYYNEKIPIFLFTVYAKSEKDNINNQEKKILKKIIKFIVQTYGEEHHE